VSRAVTLVIALLALHLMLGALSLVIGRGEHKSPALRWWGTGLLMYAAGLVWVISGIVGWRALAVTGGNTLIAASSVLCAMGVLSHTQFKLNMRWIWAGLVATAALMAVNSLSAQPDHGIDFLVPTIMGLIVFTLAGVMISRNGPRESRMANRFLGAILLFAVVIWTARVVAFYILRPTAGDAQALDAMTSFFAIVQMLIGVAATLALFWIDVRLMQAQLSRMADTDILTGLPNRRAVLQRFQEEVSRASRRGEHLGMAILDLDRFKEVNDVHGHAVGDEMLKAAAAAFASVKREEDILARIGGEEFLVLLPSCQSRDGAVQAAERMREAVERVAVPASGKKLGVTTSVGVALYPDEGADWDTLFTAADRRLYTAKSAGRNLVIAGE
jgi:diguanylate cyclase (GGDEF)-like protein